MPEVHFSVRWPDGSVETCYSPSSTIEDYLRSGETYSLRDFLDRSRAGLGHASDRVKAVYGVPCSRAAAQLSRIEQKSSLFSNTPKAAVTCLSFT